MADPTVERLAEALYAFREHLPAATPLGPKWHEVPADVREAYRRLAGQLSKRVDREGELERLRAELARHTEYQCPQCGRWATWSNGRSVRLGDEADEFWCQTCGGESPLTACSQRLVAEGLRADLVEAQRVAATLRASRTEIRTKLKEAEAERDQLAAQVKRVEALRDRWKAATRDPSAYASGGVEHAAALAASHLPELCSALDGTEADGA